MLPQNNHSDPMKDIEVTAPPDDTISAMKFSPVMSLSKNFLLAGSWEVDDTESTISRAMTAPVLDVCWHDDISKAFIAGADKIAQLWDLAAVKTCHWFKAPFYSCLMTGSWDKTLKFWDLRQPNPNNAIWNCKQTCHNIFSRKSTSRIYKTRKSSNIPGSLCENMYFHMTNRPTE